MNFYFPQWQGSGPTNEILVGAKVLKTLLSELDFIDIPLSNKSLTTKNSIFAFDALLDQLGNFSTAIIDHKPHAIFTVGGDCGLEIVPVSYLNKIYTDKLAVIWLDAHADLNTPEDSPSKNFHGMPLRTLLGHGDSTFDNMLFSHIRPDQLFYLGLRLPDPPEQSFINKNNIYYSSDIDKGEVISILKERGYTHLYVHIDLDALDPQVFSHTKYQVPNGISAESVTGLLKTFKQEFTIAGVSILEATANNPDHLQPISDLIRTAAQLVD